MKQKITYATDRGRRLIGCFLVALFVLIIVGLSFSRAEAAGTATLFFTTSSMSVTSGSTVSLTIQENSGAVQVNAVQADVTYDKTKLQFATVNTGVGPFSLTGQATGGNGTVNIGIASPSAVTGTQTVAQVTFTVIGTGSTSVTFAATSEIDQISDSTNVLGTKTGTTITVVCPSGQTGTPPNCVTPTPPPSGGTSTGSTGGTTTTTTGGTSTGTTTGSTTGTSSTPSTGTTTPTDTTTQPTTTPTTTTTTGSTSTGGSTATVLRVGVHYKDGKPIGKKTIKLHSKVQTVTTDANGIATFTNVPFGNHEVVYEQGGKTFSQALSVGSLEAGSNAVISVTLPVDQPSYMILKISLAMIPGVLLLGVVAYAVLRLHQRSHSAVSAGAMDYASAPVAVAASVVSPPQVVVGDVMRQGSLIDEQPQHVEHAWGQPGTVVSPSVDAPPHDDGQGM